MPYELKIKGRVVDTFDRQEEALAYAQKMMQDKPELEPEVFDATTGKPVSPGASKEWRDDLAGKVGF